MNESAGPVGTVEPFELNSMSALLLLILTGWFTYLMTKLLKFLKAFILKFFLYPSCSSEEFFLRGLSSCFSLLQVVLYPKPFFSQLPLSKLQHPR